MSWLTSDSKCIHRLDKASLGTCFVLALLISFIAGSTSQLLVFESFDFREIYFMTHPYEDLSYDEIADIAGVPAGTIKSRVFHGKKNLLQCLKSRVRRQAV